MWKKISNFVGYSALFLMIWGYYLLEIAVSKIKNGICTSGRFTGRELRRFIPFAGIGGLLFFTDAQTFRLVMTMVGMVLMLGVAAHVSRRIIFWQVDMGKLYKEAFENKNPEAAKVYCSIVAFQAVVFIAGAMLLS